MVVESSSRGFSQRPRQQPSGASLSLHALARIVHYFPHGVPLAFIAASPLARLAAETYRAEENYRWTPDGLELREAGERETFDVYEARRVRRAGVQLGRMIVVYHDALGHLERDSRDVGMLRPASLDPALVVKYQNQTNERMNRSLQSLLAEERQTKSIFVSAGLEDRDILPAGSDTTETATHAEAPSGGLLLRQPDQFSTISFDSRRKDGEPMKVYYLQGPNKRSIYLWMDEEQEQQQQNQDREEEASPSPAYTSIHQRDLTKKPKRKRPTMAEVVAASRWWFQRPAVSTLRYQDETAYSAESPLLPPPPASIYLHLYGVWEEGIATVLNALLPSAHTVPPPTEADLERERLAVKAIELREVQRRTTAGEWGGGPTAGVSSSSHADVLNLSETDEEAEGGANASPSSNADAVKNPPSSAGVAAARLTEKDYVDRVLRSGQHKHPDPEWVEQVVEKSKEVDAVVSSIRETKRCHVNDPVLEGLFIIGHPLMSMRLTASTAVQIAHSHLGSLKILKLNGVYADDTGIQALLQLHASQGREVVRENAGTPLPLAVLDGQKGEGGPLPPNAASSPVIKLLHSTTSMLEVADFGFCLGMTIFPLLVAPRDYYRGGDAYSVVTPLQHLVSLNFHATAVANDVLAVTSRSCPALEVLNVGSCQYITDLKPLGTLRRLRVLDAHGSGVDNVGIASITEGDFPSLEELSLAGCTRVSEVAPLACLERLRKLDLRHTPVRRGLADLQRCTRLRELAIFSDATAIEQMRHRQPELYKPDYFAFLYTLVSLSLENLPNLTSKALELIAFSHSPVQSLVLSRVPRLESLHPLREMVTLRYLSVQEADSLQNQGLDMGALPLLERLTIRRCRQLSDFNALHRLPALRYLDARLNHTTQVSSRSFDQFECVSKAYPLETLLISSYKNIADLRPFRGLPLRLLDARQTGIDDDGVELVLSGRRIESVYLSYCTRITAVNVLARLAHLRVLDVSGTRVTDHGVWELCRAPHLQTLLLENCPGLKFEPFLHVFNRLEVLSLARNPQLNAARLKKFLFLSNDSEEKYINPLFPVFYRVRDLDISYTSVDAVAPLVPLRQLQWLRAAGTPITPDGLHYLTDMKSLEQLDLRGATALEGELRPLFTQHQLRRLDLRGAALHPEKVELPLPILADSLLRELVIDERGQHHLSLLHPLLASSIALPHLRLLLIDGDDFTGEGSDADRLLQQVKGARPLLSVRFTA